MNHNPPPHRLSMIVLSFSLSCLMGWLLWQQTNVIHAAAVSAEQAAVDCADASWSVSTSEEWNDAISCFNAKVVVDQYEINFTADIVLAGNTNISNTTGASLYIHGNGHSLDGDATYRVIRMDNGLTTIDTLTVTNGGPDYRQDGAGIYVDGGTFTVTNSAVVYNRAGEKGAGIYVANGEELVVLNSQIAYNEGYVVLDGSGAGIYLANNAIGRIENSVIHDNLSQYWGGGIYVKGTVYISNTAIYDNIGRNGGGGIFNESGEAHVINSTISGNRRTNNSDGDGIFTYTSSGVATTYLTHTTVINNDDQNIRLGNGTSSGSTYVYLYNSIVVGSDNNCDSANSQGTREVISSYSLDNDGSCVTDGVDGNITDADFVPSPLQDNGGTTPTSLPTWESTVVDVIPVGVNGCGTTYTTDQRGEARLNGGGCDMGATEVQYCGGSPYAVGDHEALAQAITCYNGTTSGQTVINFTKPIVLTDEATSIDNTTGADLYIQGNGYSLNGDATYRVMRMDNGLTTIDTLTVTNGGPDYRQDGAGIYVGGGTFTVTNSAVVNNRAGERGAGIYVANGNELVVLNSQIAYNEGYVVLDGSGAGIYLANNAIGRIENSVIHDNLSQYWGGGIYVKGTVYISNTAIYDNIGRNGGGGIFNESGEAHVINSTISGNRRTNNSDGDGIFTYTSSGVATTYLTHTTVINNDDQNIRLGNGTSSGSTYVYLYNSIVVGSDNNCDSANSQGTREVISVNSLDNDGGCVTDGVDGNITDADFAPNPLQDNGGTTPTSALDSDSPAVDHIPYGTAGCGTTYTTDQRGENRPVGTGCDIGAYEYDPCAPSTYVVASESELNLAIDCYNAASSDQKVIQLSADIPLLTDTTPISNANSTILSIEGNNFAIDGNNQARNLYVVGSEVSISDITLQNGYINSGQGAALRAEAGSVVTLTNSTIISNAAPSGGGLSFYDSIGRVENSTISGNDAFGWGGGGVILRNDAQVDIVDTTIYSNTALVLGGGIRVTVDGILTVTNSTIIGNYSADRGGGININEGSATVINSTISHNQAVNGGGGVYGQDPITLLYTTIASNTASAGTGGGVAVTSNDMNLEAVLLAHNSGADCAGTVTDNGYNLATDASCGFSNTGSQNSVASLLRPLANNGGETETHAISIESPAFNQIPNGVLGCGAGITSDQRGVARPQGTHCDVGAFELSNYTITTLVSGDGKISSVPAGIDCPVNCTADLYAGETVTLTATANVGATFTGWSGACSGTADCVITINQAQSVTAIFALNSYDLTIAKSGTGFGIITSNPNGIACGNDCVQSYDFGTTVTLTAVSNSGATFTGWSGVCSGTADCVITIDQAKSVTATFTINSYDLTVAKSGTGFGTVTSDPAGIDCGNDCSETIAYGNLITLTATADLESQFTGWSGACSGNGTCVVTMDEAKSVTAEFALNQYTLIVGQFGDGTGTVDSIPSGIDCGADCSQEYAYGTSVTLTANADGSSVFTGWLGDCMGQNCSLTIDSNKAVTATFAQSAYDLNVVASGDGSDTAIINSDPVGIDCGGGNSNCQETYDYNTVVTLTASYDAGQMALVWGGACGAAVGNSCTLTMNQLHNATATFTRGLFSLGTNLSGNGNGSVSSSPEGVDCNQDGGACTAAFSSGQTITLTATAGFESTFTGWSGLCSGTGTCKITLAQTEQVTATFALNQYELTVNKAGNGIGTVTSQPIAIDCGADCNETIDYGSVITLTAAAGAESQFSGWSGACAGTADCIITIDQTKQVTAAFTLNEYTLTTVLDGTGSGLIISMPSGIGCGADCAESYSFGTVVTLTAIADSGSMFSGWSGTCTGTADCIITIDQTKNVTATFTLQTYTLTVNHDGTGAGTITSVPSGVDCGLQCTASYDYNTPVTLTAVADLESTFTGWSGACSGTEVCTVSMTEAQMVTATFGLIPATTPTYTLTVSLTGDGRGLVSSDPTGINCGSMCEAVYLENTVVTLTAASEEGSLFNGWGGGCAAEQSTTCTITIDMAQTVTADFQTEQITGNSYTIFMPMIMRP